MLSPLAIEDDCKAEAVLLPTPAAFRSLAVAEILLLSLLSSRDAAAAWLPCGICDELRLC